jgi:hypothetical protein
MARAATPAVAAASVGLFWAGLILDAIGPRSGPITDISFWTIVVGVALCLWRGLFAVLDRAFTEVASGPDVDGCDQLVVGSASALFALALVLRSHWASHAPCAAAMAFEICGAGLLALRRWLLPMIS